MFSVTDSGGGFGSRGDTAAPVSTSPDSPGGPVAVMTYTPVSTGATRTFDVDGRQDHNKTSTPLPLAMSTVFASAVDEVNGTAFDFLNATAAFFADDTLGALDTLMDDEGGHMKRNYSDVEAAAESSEIQNNFKHHRDTNS